MIAAPQGATPPQPGPLPAPDEAKLAAAYPQLHEEALTVSWAATALGVPVARIEALGRAGELLLVPGPWPMRQGYRTGLGYLVPAWQLDPVGRRTRDGLGRLLAAAAGAGWDSLDLHRFMTAPGFGGAPAPAALLRAGELERLLELIWHEHEGTAEPPLAEPRPVRRRSLRPWHLPRALA